MGSDRKMERADNIVKQGYRTVKLKAGLNFPELLSFVKSIRSRYPHLSLRVDANQSWAIEQATEYLTKLHPCRIEYCEEPLAQPDIELIRALTTNSPVPIALDESVFKLFHYLKPWSWRRY